ncbi:hypothetical protein LPTSP4_19580 [Leptospira ryugenii]|uniref:Nitroreductase domain-containing protein n=1 Tax=Leptospira ryugenii TaxID=1917863 RepID=A0A2P2E0N0_9LEPT|nr:hypothetical protein [Leptospira ryugenii]GBF50433.1 hypothetical protein LPTSP4_19580 [Leptospira ryugenii]
MNQINRMQFLSQAGITMTALAFLKQCSFAFPRQMEKNKTANKDQYTVFEEPILNAILYGITAPNPHNTQAWKFKIVNPEEMLLYVDETRLLPITDPSTRQIHIGQGTFLECLAIGASSMGYEARFTFFPEGSYAKKDIGKKPIAKIKLVPQRNGLDVRFPILSKANSQDSLFPFLEKRRTVRSQYEGDLLQKKELDSILEDAKPKHSELISILEENGIQVVIRQAMDAMRIETLNVRTADESRIWFRFNDKEIQTKRDGIALPDQAVTGFQRWMLESFFMGPEPEKFHNKTGVSQFLAAYEKKIQSAKGILIWKTQSNGFEDWVKVGRDYVRFQLAAEKNGFVIHPMSQIVQEYQEMDELRKSFEAQFQIGKQQKIQMIARIGRSEYKYFTPRRELKSMLI